MPTRTIMCSRIWKLQAPYLPRHHRVVTHDGPRDGRSARVTDPAPYTAHAYGTDAAAVLRDFVERVAR